jgi:hypothetical protein
MFSLNNRDLRRNQIALSNYVFVLKFKSVSENEYIPL